MPVLVKVRKTGEIIAPESKKSAPKADAPKSKMEIKRKGVFRARK